MRTELASDADLPEGGSKCVTVSERTYALYKVAGRVYCLDNRCTHVGGPLCEGDLDSFVVECPLHGSRFDIRTGQVIRPPARAAVRTYPVIAEGGKLFVDL